MTVLGTASVAEQQAALVVAITARALFHLEDGHQVFEAQGIEAYAEYQRQRENELLEPGIAFPLVRKLLALNADASPERPRVEVILLSRNSSDTGLRIFNAIEHHGLKISRAVFTSGAEVYPYIKPFGAHLFLSANPDSVRSALEHGIAAATILPAACARSTTGLAPPSRGILNCALPLMETRLFSVMNPNAFHRKTDWPLFMPMK